MAQERIILDPSEMTEGARTEIDVTPWLDVEGVDWGDAEIEAYKAQAQVGESVIDFRLPNRQISVPLVIRDQGGTSFATARSYIQAKAALWQREGGIGKRILGTGGTVYFDVVANGLTLSGDWMQANKGVDTEAELRLETIPDFYEPEVEVASAEEKTAAELIKVIPDPGGDMPARVRIVVEEKQGVEQLGLIWAFRSRHYSSAFTAKTAYEAEELHLLDTARKVALSGASGGTVVQHGTISANWTPVVGGRIGGTAFPTNTGTNRFFARLYSTSGTLVQARLVWDVGDLVNPVENPAYQMPGESAFYFADLGEVRLDRAPIGAHRWDWQIQAKGEVGNEDFKVDKVWIVNSDEGMGLLTASAEIGMSPIGFAAQDTFMQSGGTLTGKTALRGGVWAGAGDSDDFTIDTTNDLAQRIAVSDSTGIPRYAILGESKYADIFVKVDVGSSNPKPAGGSGVLATEIGCFARYIDPENWVAAVLSAMSIAGGNNIWYLRFYRKKAGSKLTRASKEALRVPYGLPLTGTIEALILTSGSWRLGLNGKVLASGYDTDLAKGGTLGEGKIGLFDENRSSPTQTRTFDNVEAWVPTYDAVAYASKSAQITTDGMYRLDSGGSAYGPVSRVIGDLPRLPAGGLEGRSAELFLKGSRGELGEMPDTAIDDLAVKVFAKRSWLTVPGTI